MKGGLVALLLSVFLSVNGFSQNVVNTLNSSFQDVDSSFTLVDEETKDYYVLLEDNATIFVYKYSADHILKGKMLISNLEKKHQNIIGSYLHDGLVQLITTKNNKKFYGISIDIYQQKSTFYELDISLDGKVLSSIVVNNALYIIAIPSRSNVLKLTKIFGDLKSKVKTITFAKDTFKDLGDRSVLLSKITSVLSSVDFVRAPISIITDNQVSNLLTNSNPIKLYIDTAANSVMLTLDKYANYTYAISISLEDFSYSLESIAKPKISAPYLSKSNSLFFDNTLLQITITEDDFIFVAKEYPSLKEIREYNLNKNDEIIFKNTAIDLKGGSLEKERTLENTSQFLRKVRQDYPSIAISKTAEGYKVTMGMEVILKEVNAGAMAMAFGGGLIGALVSTAIFPGSNRNANMFNVPTRRISFESRFDKSFTHIEGAINNTSNKELIVPSYFTNPKTIKAQTFFEIDSASYIGYYVIKDHKYFVSQLE